MKEILKSVKHDGGSVSAEGIKISYDEEYEADGASTHGPWCIETPKTNLSTSARRLLTSVLVTIEEIED